MRDEAVIAGLRNCIRHNDLEMTKMETRIETLESAISGIAPWLSASLKDHEHDGKGEYLKACNAIFKADPQTASF